MRVVQYKTDEATRTALVVSEVGEEIRLLFADKTHLTVVPLTEGRFMKDLDYPLEKAKKKFRNYMRGLNGGTLRGLPASVMDAIRK